MEPYRKCSSKLNNTRHYNQKNSNCRPHFTYVNEEHKLHGVYQEHHNGTTHNNSNNKNVHDEIPSVIEEHKLPVHIQPACHPTIPSTHSLPPTTEPVIKSSVKRNWKLIADPFLCDVTSKVYRFNGVVQGKIHGASLDHEVVTVVDRRTSQFEKKTFTYPMDLPLPEFKVCILIN